MKISIDVIIPSFRLAEKYIVPILQLNRPQDAIIKFYIIVDNLQIQPASSILLLCDNEHVFLMINKENIGAAETRNKGISVGTGDWILFLDDDIVVNNNLLETYVSAIKQHPEETGFIGLINFPEPSSSFTEAIKVSGSMDIFTIALRKTSFAWGATANTTVNRKAIGDTRFVAAYPKSGGGEDVDFFLKVRKKNNYRNLKTLAGAIVQHPWWNNEKVDFKRPFRYGKGNSLLGYLNPEYTYYDFPNTPETLLISLIGVVIVLIAKPSWLIPLFIFIAGTLVIEMIASATQSIKRNHRGNIKVIFYVMALRFVHECGVLMGKISKLQFWRIGERFHDNGTINKISFYRLNSYKTVKWILYPLFFIYIFLRFYE
jgi:glycosyltransferase involved in cell wall biosynthesis